MIANTSTPFASLAPQQIRQVGRPYKRVRGVKIPDRVISPPAVHQSDKSPMYSPEANFTKQSGLSLAALSRKRVKSIAQKFMRAGHPFLSLR